jgi:hypothetical protein
MSELEELLQRVPTWPEVQRRQLFDVLRKSLLIHPYEHEINAKAEVILEAVSRSSDLTKRGIRGIVAEASFVIEVLPKIVTWDNRTAMIPVGNYSFDALVERPGVQVRIQVKMQRQKNHRPMTANEGYRDLPSDCWVVEVQRTRGGEDPTGENTRPYRFGEFDLLAVSMECSSRDWKSFMYAPANRLQADPKDSRCIRKFQAVPKAPIGFWTDNLQHCLDTHFPATDGSTRSETSPPTFQLH